MTAPQPRISREAARSIAAARVGNKSTGIGKVLSYDEIDFKTFQIYNFPPDVLQEFWIAYVENDDHTILKSSTVVLVSKESGEIAYVGSAQDEG